MNTRSRLGLVKPTATHQKSLRANDSAIGLYKGG